MSIEERNNVMKNIGGFTPFSEMLMISKPGSKMALITV
jgi:hypothetical protein